MSQKNVNKFLAGAVTATMVATAVVTPAAAASFKDISNIDANTQKEIERAVDLGYFVDAEQFNPKGNITRGQVAKVMAREIAGVKGSDVAGLKAYVEANNLESKVKPFTDVKNDGGELYYASLIVKDAGAFTMSKLNWNDDITRSQMAKVIVGSFGLEYKADNAKLITDIDNASTKYFIQVLASNDVTQPQAGKFYPVQKVTRQQMASFVVRAHDATSEQATVASVKAINNTTVEVTYKDAVEDVKALNFAIEGLTVTNAVVKQTDAKTVVLTTSVHEGGKEYTVKESDAIVGKFIGISAVVPTKVDVVTKSLQGKLGQEVTVSAQVTVPEGQAKAGIPVTFNIATSNSVNGQVSNPEVKVEAVTDANGVATYSYTRYSATQDTVTAYATGDRSKFSIGYVHWGVDTLLTVEAVTKEAVVNNGSNKTYKIVAKDPKTGQFLANKTFHVSLVENIGVNANKLTDATVNGQTPMQLANGSIVETVKVTTNSKGEATFTVSGKNTSATPIVFEKLANDKDLYNAGALQVTADKVTFEAIQAKYTIDVKGQLGEVAALGNWTTGGRDYTITVKDKDGKVAANELVNVAFNEDLDKVLATNTNAKFQLVDKDGNKVVVSGTDKHIKVKTNAKGEATFTIYSNETVKDYATPIVWIDLDDSNANNTGILDKDEPFAIGDITLFEKAKLQSAKLTVDAKNNTVTAPAKLPFHFTATNQSGKEYSAFDVDYVEYTIHNTGANDVKVGNTIISPNRSTTVKYNTKAPLVVESVNGLAASVEVTATAKIKDHKTGDSHIVYTNVEKGNITKYSTNVVTDMVTKFDTAKKEVTIKDVLYSYKGAKLQYLGSSITEKGFEEYLAKGDVKVSVTKAEDGQLTFNILSAGVGSDVASVLDALNKAGSTEEVEKALENYPKFKELTDEGKKAAVAAVEAALKDGPLNAGKLNEKINVEVFIESVDYTPSTKAVSQAAAVAAKGTLEFVGKEDVSGSDVNTTLTVTMKDIDNQTQYNGMNIEFVEVTDKEQTDTAVAYDPAKKAYVVTLANEVVNAGAPNESYETKATVDDVITALENNGAIKKAELTGTNLDETATKALFAKDVFIGKKIVLAGGKDAVKAVTAADGKVVVSFSQAINNSDASNIEVFVDGSSTAVKQGTGITAALDTDKKVLTFTFAGTQNADLALFKDAVNVIKVDGVTVDTTKVLVKDKIVPIKK